MSTARSVLVVTDSIGFGEMIQRGLEETGMYKVMLVDSDQEALLCIQTVAFNIAILDCDQTGGSILNLATSMRQKLPKMRLVVICSEEQPANATTSAFQPAAVLRKPVSMPTLLEAMHKVMALPNEASRAQAARASQERASASLPSAPPAPSRYRASAPGRGAGAARRCAAQCADCSASCGRFPRSSGR